MGLTVVGWGLLLWSDQPERIDELGLDLRTKLKVDLNTEKVLALY